MCLKYILMFPGQGSQRKRMFDDFRVFPAFEEIYVESSRAAKKDLMHLSRTNSIFDPQIAQQEILTQSLAMFNYLTTTYNLKENCEFMGHSLGEISAMAASGYIRLDQIFTFITQRAAILSKNNMNGGMLVVSGISERALFNMCSNIPGYLEIVIRNSETQFVVSGQADSIRILKKNVRELKRVKSKILPVSTAFHCHLQDKNNEILEEKINSISFQNSEATLISNIHASEIIGKQAIKQELIQQLVSKVNWYQSVKKIYAKENRAVVFIEVGPGNVLSKLLKDILPEATVFSTNSINDLKKLEQYFINHNKLEV